MLMFEPLTASSDGFVLSWTSVLTHTHFCCRFGNLVTSASKSGSITVRYEVQQKQGQAWAPVASKVQIQPQSVQIPWKEGSVQCQAVVVQPQGAAEPGQYAIKLVSLHPPLRAPLRAEFEVLDAHRINTCLSRAVEELNHAEQQLKSMQRQTGLKQKQKVARRRLADVQGAIDKVAQQGYSVTTSNHAQVLQQCRDEWAGIAPQRSQTVPRHAADERQQQLLAIPGVVGFLQDLIFVKDDTDARLLSWYLRSNITALVVLDYEARQRVPQAFQGTILLLSLADRFRKAELPHHGECWPQQP